MFLFSNFFEIDFKTISKLFPNSFSFLLFSHRSNSWLLSWLRGFRGNAKGYKSLINSFIEFNTVEGYTGTRARRLLPTQHIFSNLFAFDEISRVLAIYPFGKMTIRRFVPSSKVVDSMPSYPFVSIQYICIYIFFFHPRNKFVYLPPFCIFFFTVSFD